MAATITIVAITIILCFLPTGFFERRIERHITQAAEIQPGSPAPRLATLLLHRASNIFSDTLGSNPIEGNCFIAAYLVSWWRHTLRSTVRRLILLGWLIVLTYIAFPVVPRAVASLFRRVSHPSDWSEMIPDDLHSGHIIVALRFVLIAFALRALSVLAAYASATRRNRRGRRHDRQSSYAPVPELLLNAIAAARYMENAADGEPVAVFSVRRAERTIRRAWRARFGFKTPHRKMLAQHAAKVAGALRAAEAHQYTHQQEAMREIIRLMLTIATRYAQGHIGQLLDEDDRWMKEAKTTSSLEMVRVLAAGLIVTGIAASMLLLGLPAEAIGPVIGITAVIAVGILFPSRLPSPVALVDILRSSDRSAP